jgi:hypothetical protein
MEFTVIRSQWLRGKGGSKSYLRRAGDGKQCCLGFYLKACGLTDDVITGVQDANAVAIGLDHLPESAQWLDEGPGNTTYNVLQLTNDWGDITDAQREEKLIEQFAEHGVVIKFAE